MVIDNHVHIGWFQDGYHSASEVWYITQKSGMDDVVVSSTSICAYKCLCKLIVKEMKELIRLGGRHVHPILWLRPDMFDGRCRYALPFFLHSKIAWSGLKLHCSAHKLWLANPKLLYEAVKLAIKLNVPVLIHTDCSISMIQKFEQVVKAYPLCRFVFAHASPPEEAIRMLKLYENCYVDISGLQIETVSRFVTEGLINKILFGTDMPLCSHNLGIENEIEHIKGKIERCKSILGEESASRILSNTIYKCTY